MSNSFPRTSSKAVREKKISNKSYYLHFLALRYVTTKVFLCVINLLKLHFSLQSIQFVAFPCSEFGKGNFKQKWK